jgi:aminopeptidase YwaD
VQLGDFPVNEIMDYMKALGNFKKGDTTTLKVKRGTEEITLNVTF